MGRRAKNLKDWRKRVLRRDNYTCQECGTREGRLVAHHIKQRDVYPKYALNIENGITLCPSCHGRKPVQRALFFYWNRADEYERLGSLRKGWYTTILRKGAGAVKLAELRAPGDGDADVLIPVGVCGEDDILLPKATLEARAKRAGLSLERFLEKYLLDYGEEGYCLKEKGKPESPRGEVILPMRSVVSGVR